MPRDSDIATRVNRTPQDNTAAGVPLSVEAQPLTEHNAIQGDASTVLANQLADSLGVANKDVGVAFQKQQVADTAAGETDAAMGNASRPDPSKAYAAAQDHVHALASWAVDGDDIGIKAQQMGFDKNPDAKQGLADMNNWVSDQFKQRYAGSSPATMATLAPKMAELRDNLNSWYTKDAANQVLNKNQADIKTIAGSAFAKAFVVNDPANPQFGGTFDASKFDYAGINANTQSVMPGKIGNLTFLDTLVSMARDKGVPSLLTSMPDRWPDGTPTPKGSGDPAVQKMYDAAVRESTEQQKLNLGAADKFNKEANKAYIKSSETSIMDNILSGRDQTAALHAYARNADADPAFLEKAANWQHERFKQGEDAAVDSGTVASIQRDIAMGRVTSASGLVSAMDDNHIPLSVRTPIMTKLLGNLKEVQSTTVDDPATRAYQSHLETIYKPTTDAMGKFDHPAAAQQQADLLLDFRRQAMQPNADVKAIFDSVQTKYGPPIDADKATTHLPLTATDTDRAKLITSRENGTFNSTGFNASGMTMQDVKRLRGNGQISDADAAEAAKAVLARHNK